MKAPHDSSKLRERNIFVAHALPSRNGRDRSRGLVRLGQRTWQCLLGRQSLSAQKREGDGTTPLGDFEFLWLLYRADRLMRPRSRLPISVIGPDHGWCDAPADRNYNRPVELPYPASTETLWRQDGLYDLIVVIGHNACPRVAGRGSAVFLHVAAPSSSAKEGSATEGCIALATADLLNLVALCGPGDVISVRR